MIHEFNQGANDWITCRCGKVFSDSRKGRVSRWDKLQKHIRDSESVKEASP